jgi:hypothetical protein
LICKLWQSAAEQILEKLIIIEPLHKYEFIMSLILIGIKVTRISSTIIYKILLVGFYIFIKYRLSSISEMQETPPNAKEQFQKIFASMKPREEMTLS